MESALRILHLEDDPVDTDLVQELLGEARLAVEIHRVDALAEFQAALARGGYRLILSDYTLPGTDTLTALRWSRQNSPQVPFIFVSGTLGEDVAIETLKMGATDYVLKQRMQRLVPAVRRAIQEAEEQARLQQAERALQNKDEELRELGGLMDLANAFVLDMEDRITHWSRGCQRLYGFSAEQAIGRMSHELLRTRFSDPLERIKAALQERGRWEGTLVHRRADGDEVVVTSIWVLHRGQSGQPLAILEVNNDITEQKRIEQALRASEAQVRLQAAALEAAPDAISLSKTDPEGTIVWVNPAFTELTGCSAEEAIGQSHQILRSGHQDEPFYRELWETIKRGEVWRGELVNRRKDGTLYHEEMGITPLRDESGKITHYLAIKQDITERKRTEAALREGEARFRALVMASAQAVWVARPTGEIAEDSPSWRAFTGQSLEQYLGYGWLEALHPEDRQPVAEAWRRAVESRSSYQMEYRMRNAAGEYRHAIARAVPILNEDGGIREWVGMNIDVTEQRQAQEYLRQSGQRLRATFNNAALGIVEVTRDDRIVEINARLCQMLDYRREDLIGRTLHELTASEDREQGERLNARLHEGTDNRVEYEKRYQKRDGTPLWVRVAVTGMRDSSGRCIGSIGTVEDISQRRAAEEALRQATEEAQRRAKDAEERERILAAMMEHIPMGISIADAPDVNIRAVSRYGRELTGQDRRQIEGIPAELHAQRWRIFRKDGVTPASNDELPLTRATQKGEIVREEEFILQRADGSNLPILCTAAPIRDAEGGVTGGVIGWQDISGRKRAEAALRESEDRLNLAADATGFGTFDYYPDTGELIWSAHVKRHFGLGPDAQVDYGVFLRGLHPEDRDRVDAAIQNALRPESGGRYKIEYRTIGIEDGIERWLSATGQVYFDSAGRALRLIGATLDITAQKRAEAELAEARRRLESALIAGEVGTFEWDVAGQHVGGDSNFERMFGVALDEHGAAPLADYVAVMHPDDQERVRKRIALTVETGVDYEIEYRVVSGGRTRWLLVRAKPEQDASGRVVRAAGVCLDVTERKQAEEALRASEERHRLAAEELQAIMDATPAGIVMAHDPQCRLITGNSVAHEMFAVPPEQNMSATPPDGEGSPYYRIYRESREVRGGEQPMQVSASTGAVIRDVELEAVRRDGSRRVFLLTTAPLRSPDGTIRGAVGAFTDITERKRAEEALRESDAKLRAFVDSSVIGILYGDIDGHIYDCNEELARIIGRPRQDVLEGNVRWTDITPREDLPLDDKAAQEATATGRCTPYEKHYVRPDGTRVPVVVGYVLLEPERRKSIAFILDNTERKQAEEALRQSNERMKRILEVETVGVMIWDLNTGHMVDANDAFLKMMGYDRSDIDQRKLTWQKLTPPEYLAISEAEVKKFMATGRVGPYEKEYFRKDGTKQWLLFAGSSLGNNGCVEFCIDISDRKRTEEALRESNARLKKVLEVETVGVMFWDIDSGCLIEANETFLKLTAYSRAEVESRTLAWQKLTPPEYLEAGAAQVRRFLETGRFGPYEKEFLCKDGTRRWFVFAGSSLGGNVSVEFCVDISDRKRAEQELKAAKLSAEQAKAVAEEASRAKDQFLAVLSHELRTPLTPVVAAVSMLQKQWRCDQGSREALEMIRRNVEMEARLIDDLLDVTRITRGKIELDRRAIPLCEVIRRAVEVCKPDIEARQLHFGIDIGPCAPYFIHADAARLQQVFWNLLKNAIKFTPRGGCVGIRCWPDDHSVIAEVVDSGEGIDPAVLPSIFNPFEQGGTRVTRQFGGLGLGLTIAKGLVEMRGGSISAHSEGKGQGAAFRVRLPIHQGAKWHPSPDPANAPAEVGRAAPQQTRPLRILLVEDHGDTARAMRRLLMADGHEVETAGDVATAMELAQSKAFDLLISDLGLPDGSGVDLMRELRQRGFTFPSIALSGYGQEEDVRRSHEAGFAAHLTKPTSPERLVEAIGSVAASSDVV